MGGSACAGGSGGLTCVRERTLAAFCLSAICEGHPRGQALCFSAGLSTLCLAAIPAAASQPGSSSHELLLKWLVLCLAKLWAGQPAAQAHAFEANAPGTLQPLLQHPHPEVRAATCAALAALIALPPVPITPSAPGSPSATSAAVDATAEGAGPSSSASDDAAAALAALQQALLPEAVRHPMERSVASMLIPAALDASPLVRLEVSAALSLLAAAHPTLFHSAALSWQRASATAGASGAAGSSGGGGSSLGGGP
jgi:regulator-associated protein of mTOR